MSTGDLCAALQKEIEALRQESPEWLAYSNSNVEALDPDVQRDRGSRASKLGWQWECSVCTSEGPYAGVPYRIVVRFPLQYPRLPPKVQILSLIIHADVELRDPYEGQLEESFYEALAVRAGILPADELATSRPALRFAVGDEVECNVGEWISGQVVRLWYKENHWEPGRVVPYQIRLSDGKLIFAPLDSPLLVRALHQKERDNDRGLPRAAALSDAGALLAEAADGDGQCTPSDPAPADVLTASVDGDAGVAPGEAANGVKESAVASDRNKPAEPPSFSLRATLDLLHDALLGPLDTEDEEAVATWVALSKRHSEQLQVERQYQSRCLHEELFDHKTGPLERWLAPSFARAFSEGCGSPDALRAIVNEAAPGIFTFEMLAHDFCDMLLAECEHYEASGMPVVRPNSMNNYGVVLNSIGLEQMMDRIQQQFVRPLAAALFPLEGRYVDHHHSFMVQYKASEDVGLDMHTDACDVTLNVCLGKAFTGAGLTFCGLRGSATNESERRFQYRHTHAPGLAVMHLGHHRHGADDIATGERYNLVMWNKSSVYRLSRDFMSKYALPPQSNGPPDLVCLSYTHDDDYEDFKPYPEGKRPRRELGG
eukprot:CAMPEP_0119341044 /NCGR_PEP_ID=MMETSP1333-20130426/101524_1 /TAXON_ID=418940 /ORGANISM="Scyphosphaera apsteinii, Strain RCC1455" /LENGTH=598 /DNA_ID=CAMNT_0007352919 /DNA_START=35 /DNA_END=1831 /DNA_ORIENTATION=-